MLTQKIIITGSFRFPDKDAAAARVLGLGKALRAADYDVEFAGWEDTGRLEDLQEDSSYRYDGFCYFPQADLRSGELSPVRRFLRYLRAGSNTLGWLRTRDLSHVKAILVYHGSSLFLLMLACFCRQRGIRLLFDCTEWYDPRALVGGRFGIVRIDNELRMRLLNAHVGQGIVISSFLEKFYLERNCTVIRIPPLVDLGDPKWAATSRAQSMHGVDLKLVYAGTPGKKDLLGNALRGLRLIRAEGRLVTLDIIGPSRQAVLACVDGDLDLLEALGDSVVIHGRVSQAEVPSLLAMADFSILIRPNETYANAGFPTKLVESMAAGVPVLANLTGDIFKYLHNGVEGIVLEGPSPEAFAIGVRKALKLSAKQLLDMRAAARMCAATAFDFTNYVNQLGALFAAVIEDREFIIGAEEIH